MPRIKGTMGSGMTRKAIVQFDGENPADVDKMVAAAIRTFDQTSYTRVSGALRNHAVAILSANSLPSDVEASYAIDGSRLSEGDRSTGQETLHLWEVLHNRGVPPDSPAGYAVRLLYMLKEIDKFAGEKRYDEALAMALEAGQLLAEAGIKEIWEKDALRGYKVIESAREGHTAMHGTAQDKAASRALHLEAFEKARNRGLGKTAAYEAAGEECGVTRRTIQRSVAGK